MEYMSKKRFFSNTPICLFRQTGLCILFGVLLIPLHGQLVFADSPIRCLPVNESTNVGVLSNVPADNYNIYAKLAKHGQSATADIGIQDDSSDTCDSIGSHKLSGDSWVQVGTWSSHAGASNLTIAMSSAQPNDNPGANRPSIMLLSTTSPTCTIEVDKCMATINGRAGELLAVNDHVESQTLDAFRPVSPDSDQLKRVVYYIDNRPAYTTNNLEPFDLRYATHQDQNIKIVLEFASGQRLVIADKLPDGYIASANSMLFQLYRANSFLYSFLLVTVFLLIASGSLLLLIKGVERRHAWREAHGFTKDKSSPSLSKWIFPARLWARRVVVISAIVVTPFIVVTVLTNYVVTLFKVDGVSMERTLDDGNELLVNKLPVTLAQLSGRKYVPDRGSIVILRSVYGVYDPRADLSEEKFIVKRVLGLPGDQVSIQDGKVTVRTPNGEVINPDDGAPWTNTMNESTDNESLDLTLKSDEIFVSGDNRPVSIDSRANGALSIDQVVGVVVTKLW